MTDGGNWEGVTILSRVWPSVDAPPARDDAALEASLAASRARLLERRATRPQPARDDKALAAWNGLAIAALAEAGRLLGEPRLHRRRRDRGRRGDHRRPARGRRHPQALVEGRPGRRVGRAGGLRAPRAMACLRCTRRRSTSAGSDRPRPDGHGPRRGSADPAGGFFDTATDHEQLITRPKDPQDNAVPSGGAMATTVLLRLAALTGEGRYRDAAERAIGTVAGFLAPLPDRLRPVARGRRVRCRRRRRGGDRRRPRRPGDTRDSSSRSWPTGDRSRSWPSLHRTPSRTRPCRSSTIASPSTVDRPRMSVATSVCSLPVTTVGALIDQLATPTA